MTIAPGDTRQLSTLSRLGLFGAVDLEQCSELLVKCSSKSLNPGQMLLYKDQENHSMYVIVDGHLGMHLQEDASAVVTLNPGDTVGEMSVIGGQATSAFVIAQSNCKVLEIPEKLLWEFVSSDLNFAKNLMKLFVKRMLDLNRLLYQRMHEEARSKIKAEKDQATGLYNMEWMKETLPYEMTRCAMRNRALSIMILKIDRYDNFVHSYGSYTADKIFQAVANAVQIQLRGMDMAVKHDEGCIALLLIGTDEIQAENVVKRIHKAVNHLVLGDQKLTEKFTLSVGVAEMAEEDYAELLIARTQAALDRAVNDGGNQTSH
ncbi:MAG: diguanylate cyclase [Gammaproteobacteria bacterium]|nr:MAG: diguanylate cyclase [Gammaproteobacteria bacterium]